MQHNTGAAPAAPINLTSAKTTRRTGKAVRTLFLLIAIAAAAWGLYNGPWVWEWRLSRMSLPALQQRGQRHTGEPPFPDPGTVV